MADDDMSGGGNIVELPDGSRHFFPSGTTEDQMRQTLKLGPSGQPKQPQAPPTQPQQVPAQQQQNPDNWVDKLRPFIAGGAGILGATGAAMIPGVGESGIAEVGADTQSYALVDSLLKYLGANKPKSYTEALADSEKDAAVNAVAGKLINGVFRGAKAFFNAGMPEFYKLAPTTSQALEKWGMNKLATIPRFLEDYGVPTAKAEALDRSGGKGFTQALAQANAINGKMAGTNSNPQKLYDAIKGQLQLGIDEIPGTGTNFPLHKASQDALNLLEQGKGDQYQILNDVIGDTDKLSKVLKVGQIAGSPAMNVKQDLAAYKFMDMVNTATTKDLKGNIRFDTGKLGDMWNDPKMQSNFQLLYGKDGMQRVSDFFKDIAYTQQNQGTNPMLGRYLKYLGAGKFLLNMGTIAHGVTTGNLVPSAGLIGVQVGSNIMGRLLTNPTTGRMIAEMAKGTLKENPTWAAKVIGNALRNYTVGLAGADGNVTNGSFEEDPDTGTTKFVPHK